MAQFTTNAPRIDPYKSFRFRVRWDGRYVAGVSKVSGLKRTVEVIEHREGGDPGSAGKSPGRLKYEAITLERGVIRDAEFLQWVTGFIHGRAAKETLEDLRKDLIIEVYDGAGHFAAAYGVLAGWVSKYEGPELNADANEVAIEILTLEHQGCECDREDESVG